MFFHKTKLHCLFASLLLHTLPAIAATPLIAIDDNVATPLREIAQAFERDSTHKLELQTASAGVLMRRIVQGEPIELLISTDHEATAQLQAAGRAGEHDRGQLFAVGRIAIYARASAAWEAPSGLDGLVAALKSQRIETLYIGTLGEAAFYRAAEQILRASWIWADMRDRLQTLDSRDTTLQTLSTTQGAVALLPATLAATAPLPELGSSTLVPTMFYAPLELSVMSLDGASEEAIAFRSYLLGPQAQEILARYGYGAP